MLKVVESVTSGHLHVMEYPAALERVGGDLQLLQEVAQLFLDEYPGTLERIRQGLERGSAKDVEHEAHTLKGSVANFEAAPTVRAALALETLGRSGSVENGGFLFRALTRELDRLRPVLEAIVRGESAAETLAAKAQAPPAPRLL